MLNINYCRIFLIFFSIVCISCGNSENTNQGTNSAVEDTGAVPGGWLIYHILSEPATLNPIIASDAVESTINGNNIYESLAKRDYESGAGGLIDPAALEAALTDETALVTIMAVNNEIGVIQPLAESGALCRARGAAFHSDAAQAVGKIPLDVDAMKIDLLSISGHKVYGPMGVGVLYVRRRPRVRLEPLFDGGGQERGLRSGTLPLPLCVGLGAACAIAEREMAQESERLGRLNRRLYQGIATSLAGVRVNGDPEQRIPGNLNLSFAGLDGGALIEAMPRISVSTGSACTSASIEPSYVLRALGLDDDLAGAGIRIGLGRFTTDAEVDTAVETIVSAVARLRGAGTRAAE